MYKAEKQKAATAFYDAEKVRRKNNKAIQKLLKANADLENSSDRRSRYQNRKRLEKDERMFFKECEKRLYKLNLEFDIWADEEQKLDSLCKRRAMLFDVLKNTNEQLIEEPMMKSLNHGALVRQDRLLFLNKELRKNVGILSRQLVQQTKLFEQFTEKERENKEMMTIQDNYFREIRQKLKMYNLVTVKRKAGSDDENGKEALKKNQKLEGLLKSLSQQTINVPMLKYQFLCAVDEKRRLSVLNGELELEVLVLTERLSDQTGWEVAFQDVESKVKELQQTQAARLKKIEELKASTKLGTKSMFSSFPKEKKEREKLTKRLNYFRTKITKLQQEYKAFQPEIEAYIKELETSVEAAEAEAALAEKAARDSLKSKKSDESSTLDTVTESENQEIVTEESTTSSLPVKGRKQTGLFPSSDYCNWDEELEDSPEPPVEDVPVSPVRPVSPVSETPVEDSIDSEREKKAATPRLIERRPSSRTDSVSSANECKCKTDVSSRKMTRKMTCRPSSRRSSSRRSSSRKSTWWDFLL